MRISAKKAQYACAALFELALEYESGQPLQVHTIAQRQKLPANYLMQIIILLRRAGLVVSVRGSQGGYCLALSPDQINLARVITVVDGHLCGPDVEVGGPDRRLASFWLEKIERGLCLEIERQMSAMTLADIVNQYGVEKEVVYDI